MIDILLDTETLTASDLSPHAIMLANSDDIRDIEATLHQMDDESILFEGGQLVSVAAGGAGLNFIHELNPSSIKFFDSNQHQLRWTKLIIHLIKTSATRRSFIQRVFSRKALSLPIDQDSVFNFLSQPGNTSLYKRTLSSLKDTELEEAFETYCCQLRDAEMITEDFEHGACFGLALPHLPNSKLVGLSFDPQAPLPDSYRSFFLNYGWLRNETLYKKTRAILNDVPVSYYQAHLANLPMVSWMDDTPWTYLFAGTLNGHKPEEWVATIVEWKLQSDPLFPDSRLILMTSYDGAGDLVNDPLSKLDLNRVSTASRMLSASSPHFRAWRVIVSHLRGRTFCEVTPKSELGFHEITRDVLLLDEYLESYNPCDTIILHRPIAAGFDVPFMTKCVKKAWKDKCRIILFDHNPECHEFDDEFPEIPSGSTLDKWITLEEALVEVKKVLPKSAHITTAYSGGYIEENRSWFIIIDREKIEASGPLSKLSIEDLVYEFRQATMRDFKKELFSHIAAEKFKEKDYPSVVLAAREARALAPEDLNITELFAWSMCYAGDTDAAGAAIVETARLHGGVSEEIQELASKFGFILHTDRH